jgi:putative DNA-invertase from lambdoid prophage Rac
MIVSWPKRIHSGRAERTCCNARKTGIRESKIGTPFWPRTKAGENVPSGPLCACITEDQNTLAMQNRAMREYAVRRGWTVVMQVREVNSGAVRRQAREKLLEAARRREIDGVLVWRLDRWGRSVTDLLATLQELDHLGVGFVSLTEALDLTTPAGRAMAAMLAVFAAFEREVLQERTRAGMAHARQNGKRLGRPATAAAHNAEMRKLHRAGVSKSEIARRLQIGRTSVRRILGTKP